MPQTRFAGAWARKASTPMPDVPLKPDIDPEHLNPSAAPDIDLFGQNALWQESGPSAPYLPDDMVSIPVGSPVGGGGPVDFTPQDPQYGLGVGPGLTQAQSRAETLSWHEDDRGAVASRRWQAMTDRQPGEGPHVVIIPDVPLDGDSPETLQYERSGVGTANDPYARTGLRQKRWWDRFIDMHRWEVDYRPKYLRNASAIGDQPPVPNGTQLDSPFTTPGPYYGTQDSFVSPQLRRTPTAWDEPMYSDGETSGLGSTVWGL